MRKITEEPALTKETDDVKMSMIKLLQREDSQLLFALTIYPHGVVASINKDMIVDAKRINEIVHYLMTHYQGSVGQE